MANIKSAQKRVRRIERQTAVNKNRRTRIRTFLRNVEEAIKIGKKKDAETAFKAMQPEFMRGVTKGLFHRNTVARKLSRLSSRIKALG